MRKKIIHILILIGMAACVETDIVKDFSGSQVEQMLTGGEIKHWLRTEWIVDGERQTIADCGDSVRWVFEVIESDSIAAYQLDFDAECLLYDTTFFGQFSASAFENIFTDSLLFEGGDKTFMNLRYVRASTFAVDYQQGGKSYIAGFVATQPNYLRRQAEYWLTGGSSKDWYLTRNTVNSVNKRLNVCGDTLVFRFAKGSSGIGLTQLDPDSACTQYTSRGLGTFNLIPSSNEGYFEGESEVLNGAIQDLNFTSFSATAFTAEYVLDSNTYLVRYQSFR